MAHSSASRIGIVERQHVDQIAEAQPLGAARQRGDDQIGRRQHAVVGMMMLGEPGFVEAESFGKLDLLKQFVERLLLGSLGPRLIVTKSAKSHAPIPLFHSAPIPLIDREHEHEERSRLFTTAAL